MDTELKRRIVDVAEMIADNYWLNGDKYLHNGHLDFDLETLFEYINIYKNKDLNEEDIRSRTMQASKRTWL